MSDDTLTALSQRDEAFWIGLALLLGGSLLSDPSTTGPDLGAILAALGGVVLTVRILVAVFSLLETTALAGRVGYREGRNGE
ncbi:hypothetical protein [Halomarina litorea]|uniref:hypothetical protein n=1 Tax=Halomarina litorea TaxID=2961595 RepID=UPI0020C36BBF|nr:hypothetical protein [Halomarina sp. BCD28]